MTRAASLKVLRANAKSEQRAQHFLALLKSAELPMPVREYRFDRRRLWRFDFAWPNSLVALESEGGVFSGGGHTRGAKFVKDCEKYNAATIDGWRVLRVPSHTLTSEETLELVRQALPYDA